MEIYKDLSSQASKEFEKLLNSQLSKANIEEGKIIEGKINKITEKFVFLFVEGLKSEPVLDINELKSKFHKIINREDAIDAAVRFSSNKSIILIAGKGHEQFQEINGKKIPFNDFKTLKKLLNT